MMFACGKWFFRYRNCFFPVFLVLLFLSGAWPIVQERNLVTWLQVAGLVIALAGQGLRALTVALVYIKRGGKDKQVYAARLVQEGVFAHCRNPLYLGNLLILAGVGLASNSMLFALIGMPFFVYAYRAIIAAEESYLREKFGEEFEAYCKRVNRMVPNFRGVRESMRNAGFHWRRLIAKEYQTAYQWMAAYLVLVTKDLYLRSGQEGRRQILWVFSLLLVLLTGAFLLAWSLKKTRILRAD